MPSCVLPFAFAFLFFVFCLCHWSCCLLACLLVCLLVFRGFAGNSPTMLLTLVEKLFPRPGTHTDKHRMAFCSHCVTAAQPQLQGSNSLPPLPLCNAVPMPHPLSQGGHESGMACQDKRERKLLLEQKSPSPGRAKEGLSRNGI